MIITVMDVEEEEEEEEVVVVAEGETIMILEREVRWNPTTTLLEALLLLLLWRPSLIPTRSTPNLSSMD